MTSDDSVSSVVREVIDRFGRIDVLVNNAGLGINGAAEGISVAQAQRVFDVNVFGLMRMTRAVLPHMRGQGHGRVINISSLGGFVGNPFMSVYIATKHAVEGYTESLDHEIREHGVRVLCVQPGPLNTSFDTNSVEADSPVPVYAHQRGIYDEVIEQGLRNGDDPAVIAKVVVAAATDRNPKLSYPVSSLAPRLKVLRRILPARTFDKQVRKFNRMTG
ncbi:SDR family NAD(P)-dependent oxidoreductase [Streptomyces sp. NBC_00268]|uniref:SDR family NAD(P)-dependent oxidoreductase n=1 Tax=Streptomyces sp. NBC_00268 TaxID=2975695 RepID=UPI002B1D698B|nr:SDR family NAD(P)-dependent oxidoreductase [Streptomyces sp. NBC_00268]